MGLGRFCSARPRVSYFKPLLSKNDRKVPNCKLHTLSMAYQSNCKTRGLRMIQPFSHDVLYMYNVRIHIYVYPLFACFLNYYLYQKGHRYLLSTQKPSTSL